MSDQEADLEALTISFAGLDITVRRRASRTARSSEEDFVLVEAPSSGPAVASDEALLEAYSASALAALHLLQLARFSDRLTGAGGEWTAARTARAYRAGVGARRFLAGGRKISSPPAAGLRNVYYIILRAPGYPDGFWTRSAQLYFEAVRARGGPRGSLDSESASHAFASQSEAESYLLGAGREWPPQRV